LGKGALYPKKLKQLFAGMP